MFVAVAGQGHRHEPDQLPMLTTLLWIPATVAAAAAQTLRNAMQRHLTGVLGTVGATQVRFLYGLPFAILFLLGLLAITGEPLPVTTPKSWAFTVLGALTQILATGLMLAVMKQSAFAITTAYTKTEPVQVALFGLLVLGDPLSWAGGLGCLIATVGVALMSWKPGRAQAATGTTWDRLRPAALGILAGAAFAVASVGYRGGILALADGSFLMRATTTLVIGLALQTAVLVVWMLAFDRPAFWNSLGAWRQSVFAGFMGAFASQCWFIGFALTTAANVRTLGLLEVLFAQGISAYVLHQPTGRRELAGMALVVIGVGWLLWSLA
jgi:drug/metabolite transporter (DMT)-like permease